MSEQAVDIAGKLYSARRSLKSLFPSEYQERIAPWQEVIRRVMADKGLSELKALIDILGNMQGHEISQLWVMAAVVEMLEPSV